MSTRATITIFNDMVKPSAIKVCHLLRHLDGIPEYTLRDLKIAVTKALTNPITEEIDQCPDYKVEGIVNQILQTQQYDWVEDAELYDECADYHYDIDITKERVIINSYNTDNNGRKSRIQKDII